MPRESGGGCPPAARDDRRLYSHATFPVKNRTSK